MTGFEFVYAVAAFYFNYQHKLLYYKTGTGTTSKKIKDHNFLFVNMVKVLVTKMLIDRFFTIF